MRHSRGRAQSVFILPLSTAFRAASRRLRDTNCVEGKGISDRVLVPASLNYPRKLSSCDGNRTAAEGFAVAGTGQGFIGSGNFLRYLFLFKSSFCLLVVIRNFYRIFNFYKKIQLASFLFLKVNHYIVSRSSNVGIEEIFPYPYRESC